MTPVLPVSGDVEITGTVTNVSDETFTRVNLTPSPPQRPILDSFNLANSAAIDPHAVRRRAGDLTGHLRHVDALAPVSPRTFSDTVPVELLELDLTASPASTGSASTPSVTAPSRATSFADGRARTFIPRAPSGGAPARRRRSILPIRSRVWFDEDGAVAGTERWARRLAEGGSLDGVLDMADSAGSAPYSWLVDPAVLTRWLAWRRATRRAPWLPTPPCPARTARPSSPRRGRRGDAGRAGRDAHPDPAGLPTEEPTDEEAELAASAAAWLERFRRSWARPRC